MPFTQEQDAVLRACYSQNKYGNNAHRKAVRALGLNSSAVLRRAVQLGLTYTRERYRWTQQEMDIVEKHAHHAIETIQRHLAPFSPIKRTRAAIVGAIHEGRYRTNLDGLNHRNLSDALGIAVDTLHKYRIDGLIKSAAGRLPSLDIRKRRSKKPRPEVYLSSPWFYSNREIRTFIYCHPGLIDLKRVAKLWFIDLLRDGRQQGLIDQVMYGLKNRSKLRRAP